MSDPGLDPVPDPIPIQFQPVIVLFAEFIILVMPVYVRIKDARERNNSTTTTGRGKSDLILYTLHLLNTLLYPILLLTPFLSPPSLPPSSSLSISSFFI